MVIKIGAHIAILRRLLWGRLLSYSVEIREHLTGLGSNMGAVTWGSFVLLPGDPGAPEWHMS